MIQMVSGVSVAGLAGCFGGSDPEGGGGDDGNGTTEQVGRTRTTRRPSVIGTSTAARDYPSYDWALLNDEELVDTNEIEIVQNSGTLLFDPLVIRVPPGATVTWENTTTGQHTVTIPRLDFDEFVFGGDTIEVTFDNPGVYNYLCKNHSPDHIGRIVVDESQTPYPGSGGTATGTTGGTDGTDTDSGAGDGTDTDADAGGY